LSLNGSNHQRQKVKSLVKDRTHGLKQKAVALLLKRAKAEVLLVKK
jgi:hypothetical protein